MGTPEPKGARLRRHAGAAVRSRRSVFPAALGWACLGLLTLHAWPAAGEENAPPPAPAMEVVVEDGLLTMDIQDAPLAEVLHAIGEAAGFQVVLVGSLDRRVSWSAADVPLTKGLRRLLADESWLMVHDRPRGRDVARLRVLGEGNGSASVELVPAIRRAGRSRGTPAARADAAGRRDEERLFEVRKLTDRPNAGDVERLAGFLAEDEDPTVRRIAAIGLGKVGGDRALDALAAAVADEDVTVRNRAVRALAETGDRRAFESLRTVLAGDPDRDVRRVAARALAAMDDEEALLALQTARYDPDRGVRAVVADALERAW